MIADWILGLFLGVGLAASVGFRVFVPLFLLSLATYFGIIPLNDNWNWIASKSAIILLGIATIVEVFAYFIPFIDNLLDTIALPLATVAGTLVVVATSADLSPVVTWALAIIAGGGTAATIKGITTTTRATSSVSTAGVANPIIAGAETASAGVLSIVSLFLPVLGIILVFFIFVSIRKLYKILIGK